MNRSQHVRACWLGSTPYREAWDLQADLVRALREGGGDNTLLLLEHPHVFTMGRVAAAEHVLWDDAERSDKAVDLIWSDRGGEATYHGPGQLVVYPLVDLRRAQLGVRDLVTALETSVIDLAAGFAVSAQSRRSAPGVYVAGKKLASIGIRVRRGASYHGLALNVALDLEPFRRINPCGYPGLEMTQLSALGGPATVAEAAAALQPLLLGALGLI